MPKTKTSNAKITAAALHLAAAKGWTCVTLAALSRDAKIPLADVKKRFSSPHDIIPAVIEAMTQESLKAAGKTTGSPRDVLFDLLMARFDILQRHRKAILSITDAAQHDHALACVLGRAVLESMLITVDAAKLKAPRFAAAAGLSAIYGWSFLAWARDETPDMAKTMASLDRALKLAEKAATLLCP